MDIEGEKQTPEKQVKNKRTIQKWKSLPSNTQNSNRGSIRSKKWTRDLSRDVLQIDDDPPQFAEEEAVGIITMEDVIEELLQVC